MTQHNKSNLKLQPVQKEHDYTSLDIRYEKDLDLAWYFMHAQPRPCCTPALVAEIQQWFDELADSPHQEKVQYIALASKTTGIFNLGGDLEFTIDLIRQKDRDGLLGYARLCVDTLWQQYMHLDRDITTISLVQGDALGGGLEYALSSDVIIAEKRAKMGMPEILFNLFPGVGAYSLLSRKIGARLAEEIIQGGRLYSAVDMHEMGIVDVLADDGEGEMAVHDYIRKENRSRNGIRAFRAAKRCTNPLEYSELLGVAEIWADAALRLRDRDLRMMERLVLRQSAKTK